MKKLFLILLLIVVAFHSSYSQITFGFKAGLNRSKVQYDLEQMKYTNRIGFYGGALTQIDLTEKRFMRAELLYSVKGSKFPAVSGYTTGGKSSFNYLNISLYQGYRPIKNLSVIIGPEIGYLLSAKTKHDGKEVDIKNGYNKLDLAANVGLGYQITPLIGIEARYSYGFKFMNVYRERDDQGVAFGNKNYDGANRVFQFGLTYYLVRQE